ncbi:MAG TPA: MFS transporter, partial [Chthoniobacteraceae bacterium]
MHLPRHRLTSTALFLTLLAAFLGWMFDGLEMGIFPIVARPALKEMAPNLSGANLEVFVGYWMSWATALFLWGAAAGGLVFGWLGDRFGRVRAMSWSVLTYSVFTGVCYYAKAPWHLAGLRFVAALGMGGEWALGVALVMEVWPENKRPLLAALIGAASNVGFALIASLELVIPAMREKWRLILLAGAAPALLTFLIQRFVPESHRWETAVDTQKVTNPVREIFRPNLRRNTLVAMGLASVALIATWGAVQWLALWAPLLPGARPNAKNYVQIASAVGAILGGFVGAGLAAWIGRRFSYTCLCVLSLGVCTWVFRSSPHYDTAFFVGVFLIGCFTASFYGWMPLYLPELFPTSVRATAQGLAYNFGRILAGFGALGTGSLVASLGGDYAKAGGTIVLIYILGILLI